MRWRLGEILQARGLTAYKLAGQLNGKVNRNSVYAIARGDTDRVDRATLGHLLSALGELTGQRYTVGDLLEYSPEEESAEAETAATLADHPDILDRVERLESGAVRMIPLEEVAAKYGVKL
ncbi:helix-turn-helix domain-containing protein [Deinococcus sp. YIM 134068]|uniref:helix-turn-helix domain-containing protein n=1 Tax=Deinococcus lichenicola TaxID=3118910 RepID=UPI002F951DC5